MVAAARRWCGFGLHGPGECAQEEEQGEADAVVCLAWPATEYNSKNDSVAASSGARPWWPREGTRREARRRARSGEASRPSAPLLGVRRRARGKEQDTRQRRRRAATTSASGRTGGGHRCGYGGAQVWASYGPIWSMGPKRSFLYSARSTFFIKRPRSFEEWISS